jgi:hypothetical protein
MHYAKLSHRFKTLETLAPWLQTQLAEEFSVEIRYNMDGNLLCIVEKASGAVEVSRTTKLCMGHVDIPVYLVKGDSNYESETVSAAW